MAEETILNSQLNNETVLNNEAMDAKTVYNSTAEKPYKPETVLNPVAAGPEGIEEGQQIGNYHVMKKLDIQTGEADLYLVEADGARYVLKHYRRNTAIKEEIFEQLKNIESPYIAKLIDTGMHLDRPYEIIPYYEKGSLQGKKYSFAELKEVIIPELNEALKVLHDRNIVHKDLKPSNIMLCDNERDIALIDFGISSIKEEGNTIILTRTGFTPDYTAHEAFNGLFLNESDYYSLGITLYELYTGTTPYKNMTAEEIELYTSIQKIPLPDDMEQELKDLIGALTYYDITNRKDKSNPNRRWTYEEVVKWLHGEKQIIPGSGVVNSRKSSSYRVGTAIEKYVFMGTEYTDRHKLAVALARNWEDAKLQLFNGMLSRAFKDDDPEFATACSDAMEAYGKGIDSDLLLFRILYRLDRTLDDFIWKGHQYNSLEAFGRDVQDKLRYNIRPDMSLVDEILKRRISSEYLYARGNIPEEMKKAVAAIETGYANYSDNYKQRWMNYHLLGYLLSGRKTFYMDEQEFADADELIIFLQDVLKASYKKFEEYCNQLIDKKGSLNMQLETWLMAIGKKEQLDRWKEQLS